MLAVFIKTYKQIFNETYSRATSGYLVAVGRLAVRGDSAGDFRIGSFRRYLSHLFVCNGLLRLDAVRR